MARLACDIGGTFTDLAFFDEGAGELVVEKSLTTPKDLTRGIEDATVYDPRETSVGGTHAIFVVRSEPADYNLPANPQVPTIHLRSGWTSAAAAAGLMLAGTVLAFLSSPAKASSARDAE